MFSSSPPATSRCSSCNALSTARSGVTVRVSDVSQPAGSGMAPHAHDTARLIINVEGRYDERSGSRVSDCRAGTAFFRPAGVAHSDSFAYEDVRYVAVALPQDIFENFGARRARRFRSAFAVRSEAIAALGARLAAEVRSPDAAAPIALEGMALELLAQLELRGDARVGRPPRWIASARAMIDAGADSVTPGAIARELDLDASYVARAFRAHLGRTLGDCIRDVRIARAVRRLTSEPSVAVADVALEAGFFDQSHFNRAFKRVVGLTPQRYRGLDRASRLALERSKSS